MALILSITNPMSAIGVTSHRIVLQDYIVLVPDHRVTPAQLGPDALPVGST